MTAQTFRIRVTVTDKTGYSNLGGTDPDHNSVSFSDNVFGQPFLSTATWPSAFTYNDASGNSQNVTLTNSSIPIQSSWNCPSYKDYGPGTGTLTTAVNFPDKTTLGIGYEPTSPNSSYVTGRLGSLTLPTGGTITFSYGGGNAPGPGTGMYCGEWNDGTQWMPTIDTSTADTIARFKAELPKAESINSIRLIESQAARAYWSAWSTLPINFPKNDLPRIPDHWCSFGARVSPLTGSPRLAANPPNAILNYLYSVLESEARLAAAALGLDPGLGVLHVDTSARDSLACDLMEPIRSQIDAYLLDWITRQPLRREWFCEQRDGNCRLAGSFTVCLSETAPIWRAAASRLAELAGDEGIKMLQEAVTPSIERQSAEAFGLAVRDAEIQRLGLAEFR